jgi:hypothetical protein
MLLALGGGGGGGGGGGRGDVSYSVASMMEDDELDLDDTTFDAYSDETVDIYTDTYTGPGSGSKYRYRSGSGAVGAPEEHPVPPLLRYAITFFYFCYGGAEAGYAGWIAVFALKVLHTHIHTHAHAQYTHYTRSEPLFLTSQLCS